MVDHLHLNEACRRAGIQPKTAIDWQWRARRGLPIPGHAEDFCRLMSKPGGRWMVDAEGLGHWLGRQHLADQDQAALQQQVLELAARARAAGLGLLADVLHLAGRVVAVDGSQAVQTAAPSPATARQAEEQQTPAGLAVQEVGEGAL